MKQRHCQTRRNGHRIKRAQFRSWPRPFQGGGESGTSDPLLPLMQMIGQPQPVLSVSNDFVARAFLNRIFGGR